MKETIINGSIFQNTPKYYISNTNFYSTMITCDWYLRFWYLSHRAWSRIRFLFLLLKFLRSPRCCNSRRVCLAACLRIRASVFNIQNQQLRAALNMRFYLSYALELCARDSRDKQFSASCEKEKKRERQKRSARANIALPAHSAYILSSSSLLGSALFCIRVCILLRASEIEYRCQRCSPTVSRLVTNFSYKK